MCFVWGSPILVESKGKRKIKPSFWRARKKQIVFPRFEEATEKPAGCSWPSRHLLQGFFKGRYAQTAAAAVKTSPFGRLS